MTRQLPTVAVVDDDVSFREALVGLIAAFGFAAEAFASAEEFLQSGAARRAACLVSDANMPGMGGLSLQARLAVLDVQVPTIFVSAAHDRRARKTALARGAIGFLDKPIDTEQLLALLRSALVATAQEPNAR